MLSLTFQCFRRIGRSTEILDLNSHNELHIFTFHMSAYAIVEALKIHTKYVIFVPVIWLPALATSRRERAEGDLARYTWKGDEGEA